MKIEEYKPDEIKASIMFNPNIKTIENCLKFIDTLTEDWGFEEDSRFKIRLAIDEILLFLMKTAFKTVEHEPLKIEFQLTPASLLIFFTVRGLPMDISHLPEFDNSTRTFEESAGADLFIAGKSVDAISFINRGRNGLIITLEKSVRQNIYKI